MDFLQKLDFMMKRYGLNKRTLSIKSDIPYTTIDNWYKRGYEGLKLSTIKKLSDYFNTLLDFWVIDSITDPNYGKANGFQVSVEETEHITKYRALDGHGKEMVDIVLDKEAERVADERRRAIQDDVEDPEDNVTYFPLRCSMQPASAGTGTYLGPEAFETIYVQDNELTRRASFSVPVSGDSMEPRYHDKDILMVEGTERIKPGEIGIFTIDGEGYVKELGNGELISLNPKYAPIPMNDSIRCHGKVIGVLDLEWIAE